MARAQGAAVSTPVDGVSLTLLQPPQTAAPAATGSVSGVVTNEEGTVMTGAKVKLFSPANPLPRELSSGDDGGFLFANMPSGDLTLSVTLQGFDPVTLHIHLVPGESYVAPPIALSMATVNVSINAISSEELALAQLHTEEQQRIIGVIPNFFVSYEWHAQPLTTKQKYMLSFRNAIDPFNYVVNAAVSGIQQATNSFPGYGQGVEGYAKRFGANTANVWIGTFLGGAVFPSLFHQDPRYFYKGTGKTGSRALYAMSTAVICRGDNGRRQPAYASILGDFSAGAASNLYYPASNREGAQLTVENGLLSIANDAINNLLQEFVLGHFTKRGKSKTQP